MENAFLRSLDMFFSDIHSFWAISVAIEKIIFWVKIENSMTFDVSLDVSQNIQIESKIQKIMKMCSPTLEHTSKYHG